MAAEFLLPRSEGRPLTVRLERDAVVGRGTDAGLRISSRRVSRSHCHVAVDGVTVRVRDLGSRNGTFVNGEGVGKEEVEVPLGATLSIGGVTMRLVRAGDRTYRPDGAAMLAEVESHISEGELQDSPGGVVVGEESSADLSDDSVLVTDSGEFAPPRDVPDRPSPITADSAGQPRPQPQAEAETQPEPVEVEQLSLSDAPSAAAVVADAEETEDLIDAVEEMVDEQASDDESDAGDEAVELTLEVGGDGAEESPIAPFGGDDGSETLADEDAAFDFLNDDGPSAADADSSALATLPGADAEDQSSFAGFKNESDDEDVDSSLLGFLNDPK